jgi:hypothetical protein
MEKEGARWCRWSSKTIMAVLVNQTGTPIYNNSAFLFAFRVLPEGLRFFINFTVEGILQSNGNRIGNKQHIRKNASARRAG